jgi:uncharacterized repeat protein (TIGR01451 family)
MMKKLVILIVMKNVFKKIGAIVAAIGLFVVPSAAFAAASFNNASGDLQTFTVLNATANPHSNTAWSTSVSANPGDLISFQIYYHNTSPTDAAQNARAFFSVPTATASTFTANGTIGATNASSVSGSATVNLSSPQTLTFVPGSLRWYPNQAQPLSNPVTTAPNGQSETALLSAPGMNLGTVPAASGQDTFQYQGNIIISFRVGNSTPTVNTPTVTTNNVSSSDCSSATLSGYVAANGNSSVATYFEYGTNSSLSGSTRTNTQSFGNTSTTFTQYVSGLSANTTYYVRASATGQNGQLVQGSIGSFTTNCNVPTQNLSVQTNAATNIYSDQATLNGYVSGNNSGTVSTWFEYGPNGQLSYRTATQQYNNASNLSQTLNGLSQNVIYSFRAVAQSSNGQIVYGNILTFVSGQNNNTNVTITTNPGVPGATSCTFNGYVNANGSNTGSVYAYFDYGTNYSFSNRTVGQNVTNGPFSAVAYGLLPNTTYYFRAAGQTNNGVVTGTTYTCLTGNGAQVSSVQTLPATSVTTNSAVLNGSLSNYNAGFLSSILGNFTSFGNNSGTTWFEYGPAVGAYPQNGSLPYQTAQQNLAYGQTSFARTVFSLSPNTTYYFRAAANVNGQNMYGQVLTFTTGGVVYNPPAPTPTGPTGFSKVTIKETGANLTFPNGCSGECFAARVGDTVQYTIEVKNTSTVTNATNLVVTTELAPYFDFLGASNGGTLVGNQITWNLGTLTPGQTANLTYQVGVRAVAANASVNTSAHITNGVSSKDSNTVCTIILTNGVVTTGTNGQPQMGGVAVVPTNDAGGLSSIGAFFPQTALGWLGLLILIVLVAFLIRALV